MNIQENQIYIGISIWNCQKKKGNLQKMEILGKEIYQYLKQNEKLRKKGSDL